MPYTRLNIKVTVPDEAMALSRERLEKALDQLVIESVPVYDVTVDQECVDSPLDSDSTED